MKRFLTVLAVMGVATLGIVATPGVSLAARDPICNTTNDDNIRNLAGCNMSSGSVSSVVGGTARSVINTLLYIVGIVAVVMIIYSGIQFATSAGDAGKVQKAKNTILYSIVGLVIAILAYAIVNFVIRKV